MLKKIVIYFFMDVPQGAVVIYFFMDVPQGADVVLALVVVQEHQGLNPLFIRSQFQIHKNESYEDFKARSQSLIHQVSVSDIENELMALYAEVMSQSLIHQVSDSDSTLFFERKYR